MGKFQPSAFTPDELVRDRTQLANKEPATPPGKAARTDGLTGNAAYDNEPLCERDPGLAGCTLAPRPRGELISAIQSKCTTIGTNQKLGVMKCESEIRAQKPEELEFWKSALIGGLGIVFGNVLTPLVHAALTQISEFQVFTSAAITRLPLTFYSTKASNAWKAPTATDAKLKMLLYVEAQIDGALLELFNHAKQALTDTQLLVLDEALHPSHHTPAMYLEATRAMIDRYLASGVEYLGRGAGPVRERPGRDDGRAQEDCRVVWVVVDQEPVLFYQHVDASLGRDAQLVARAQGKFGELADVDMPNARPFLGEPVPTEFYQVATQAHYARWGTKHPVPVLTDSTIVNQAQQKLDRAIVRDARGGA